MREKIVRIIVLGSLVALPLGQAEAGEIHHGFGLAYSGGAQEVMDYHEDIGYDVSGVPVGLSYHPVIEYENGTRFDITLGPVVTSLGDVYYLNIPLSATYGYDFSPASDTSFYVRGGGAFHFLDGDFVEDSTAFGALAAAGVGFKRNSRIGFFLEASYDTAQATMSDWDLEEDISPQGFNLTFGISF